MFLMKNVIQQLIIVTEAKITPDTAMLDNVPFGQPVDKSQFRKVRKCADIPKGKQPDQVFIAKH